MSSTAPECEPEPKKRCVDRAGAAGVEVEFSILGGAPFAANTAVIEGALWLLGKDGKPVLQLAVPTGYMLADNAKIEDERDERRGHQDASETNFSDQFLEKFQLAFATVDAALAGLRDDLAVRVGEDEALGVALMMVNTAIAGLREKVANATWHFGDDGSVVENGGREGSTR